MPSMALAFAKLRKSTGLSVPARPWRLGGIMQRYAILLRLQDRPSPSVARAFVGYADSPLLPTLPDIDPTAHFLCFLSKISGLRD